MGKIAAVRRALVLLLVLFPLLVAACGGGENKTTAPEGVQGTTGAEATTGEETMTGEETTTGEQGGGNGNIEGDPEAGKEVFASAGCGGCHTLQAAGTSGTTGPNLDDAQPSYEEARKQIENGGGGMPAFKDQLSEDEIKNVAAFVVEATTGG